jgi:hypothetical protein
VPTRNFATAEFDGPAARCAGGVDGFLDGRRIERLAIAHRAERFDVDRFRDHARAQEKCEAGTRQKPHESLHQRFNG